MSTTNSEQAELPSEPREDAWNTFPVIPSLPVAPAQDSVEDRKRLIAEHKAKVKAMRLAGKYASTVYIKIITDEDANCSCVELGLEGTLEALNRIFRTTHALTAPFLQQHIQYCVDNAFDVGLAYAYLRPHWYSDFEEMTHTLEACRAKDEHLRTHTLQEDRITNPSTPPRRVWDLCSNRVVPYWVMDSHTMPQRLWAVSHSWMPLDKRRDVLTDINGRKWPVPMPIDVTLEDVRVELMNFGAEYVWLDVLCLRQYGGVEEHLRADEWKLDVPTIGQVYHADRNQNVVCYYSGLGRPFTVEKGFMDEPRHWINRAWTLQETSTNRIVGGWTDASPVDTGIYGDSDGDKFYRFLNRLAVLSGDRPTNIFPILEAMQKRASVNPVDKVAGLAYILQSTSVPIYKENEDVEDAWMRLVENMHERYRGDMFFLYPAPGDGVHQWRPSWRQVTEMELPSVAGIEVSQLVVLEHLERMPPGYTHVYQYSGSSLENCIVMGLSQPPANGEVRKGEVVVERSGERYTFKVSARHEQLIPEESFALVGGYGLEHWVVGKSDALHANDTVLAIHKVSVLRMDEEEGARLRTLKFCVRKDVFLY